MIFDRISAAVDTLLRGEQAGFRKGISCSDQTVFTLRQILEQCHEWNISVYTNFIDFVKAFDIVSIIQLLYNYLKSKVICGNCLSEEFEIKTETRVHTNSQVFSLGVDWLIKETMQGGRKGIKWTFTETLIRRT